MGGGGGLSAPIFVNLACSVVRKHIWIPGIHIPLKNFVCFQNDEREGIEASRESNRQKPRGGHCATPDGIFLNDKFTYR